MITKKQLTLAGAGSHFDISGYFMVRVFEERTQQYSHIKEYALIHHLTPGTIEQVYEFDWQSRETKLIFGGASAMDKFQKIVARGPKIQTP